MEEAGAGATCREPRQLLAARSRSLSQRSIWCYNRNINRRQSRNRYRNPSQAQLQSERAVQSTLLRNQEPRGQVANGARSRQEPELGVGCVQRFCRTQWRITCCASSYDGGSTLTGKTVGAKRAESWLPGGPGISRVPNRPSPPALSARPQPRAAAAAAAAVVVAALAPRQRAPQQRLSGRRLPDVLHLLQGGGEQRRAGGGGGGVLHGLTSAWRIML